MAAAPHLPLQHRERVLRRRAKVLWSSLGVIATAIGLAFLAIVLLFETNRGNALQRKILLSQAANLLAGRGHLYVGHMEIGLSGDFIFDSVTVADSTGVFVATVGRIEGNAGIAAMLRGRVHISRLLLVRPYVVFEQYANGTWNIDKLFPPKKLISLPTARSTLSVTIDSAVVRDGHLALVQPDSLPKLPRKRRDFTQLQMRLGATEIMHPGKVGGSATILALAMNSSNPPLTLRQAIGTVNWWADSLIMDFASFRLPASRATLRGSIDWAKTGPPRLNLHLNADSVSLADVAWVTTLIPKSGGTGSAELVIRSGKDPHNLEYVLSKMNIQMTKSRLAGGFTAIVGKNVSIVNLALDARPFDLDLVREIFGDSLPPKVWQGALTGTVQGTGGPLTALRLNAVDLTFTDRRANNAVSQLSLSGVLDVKAKPVQLHQIEVQLHDLDVRTLGAVSKTADSLHGVLRGRLVLDGPANNLLFHDLSLVHVDGDLARSYVRGDGRLATDHNTHWLDATLALDTIAVATLASPKSTVPWRGSINGKLVLAATRDSLQIDALLHAGAGTAHFLGVSLLDSTRTWLQGTATLNAIDPRVLIARKDIPVLRLDGTATIDVDIRPSNSDTHVDIELDTTSILGTSHVTMGHLRAGGGTEGFHVDTAEIHATAWQLSAHGRLAKTGVMHDSLTFAVKFDSLAPLRALVLDTAGLAFVDSLHGAFAAKGVLIGSLDTLTADVAFNASGARWTGFSVDTVSGHAALANLPRSATGVVSASAKGVIAKGFTADSAAVRATVTDGTRFIVSATGSRGDTLAAAVHADARVTGDTTRIAIDTMNFKLGNGTWKLDRATYVVVTPGAITIDSTQLHSSRGAVATLSALLPDIGPARATLNVRSFGVDELAFTGIVSPDFTGRVAATVDVQGTRDQPLITLLASVDSIKVGNQLEPALSLSGKYAEKKAQFTLGGADGKKKVLNAIGTVPIDLTLRKVDKRLIDGPLSVHVVADSASIAGFEAVIPAVTGLSGTLSTDVMVTGTWKKLAGAGVLHIRNGTFDHTKTGIAARGVLLDASLTPDSIIISHLRMADASSPGDTASLVGVLYRTKDGWLVSGESFARNFMVMDDPGLAVVSASWHLNVSGALKEPHLSGDVLLPSAVFTIDTRRRVRQILNDSDVDSELKVGEPLLSGLTITLGNDVRLKSVEANVQLSGSVEVGGQLHNPYVSGTVNADRGTYRVDLGVLKRTFRVDSGTVQLAGTLKEVPPALDIWTSYVVRRADRDDITIGAHLTGTTDRKVLTLTTNDLGSAVAQSEIISYLVFGTPSFALDGQSSSTVRAATAALVPSLGGVLEGVLGTFLPFFNSLQVTTIAGEGPQNLTTNPLDGLLNSFALTAGRQIGSDTFLNLSGGRCSGSRVSSAGSVPGWFGISAEYRPRYSLGAIISLDPGSSPCNRVGNFSDIYQFGLDLFKDWKF